jgi:hypothetical protein
LEKIKNKNFIDEILVAGNLKIFLKNLSALILNTDDADICCCFFFISNSNGLVDSAEICF